LLGTGRDPRARTAGISIAQRRPMAKPKWLSISGLFDLDIDETPSGPLTDMGWPLSPEGLENLVVRWHKEHDDKLPPLYITENSTNI